jgi:hypothetical protein
MDRLPNRKKLWPQLPRYSPGVCLNLPPVLLVGLTTLTSLAFTRVIDFDDYETRHDCVSVYGGLPEIVIPGNYSLLNAISIFLPHVLTPLPVGQYSYRSVVSEREEVLPMCMSLLGARGSDATLLQLTRLFLEKTGRGTSVATGSEAFPRYQTQG